MPLLTVAMQVMGLVLLARLLRIESPAFFERVAPLAAAGAVVNHLLPATQRLRFFGVLSIVSVWLVFGVVQGSWIVGIGLLLIALCHLPVPFTARLLLLLAAGLTLAAMRAEWLPVPFSTAIWAVLGSMFMFRLIVYVYDLRHMKDRTKWEERVAYFFALPNVAFPLFPVIDFATFRRTYYDRAPVEIYRQGVDWIVRGLLHLVAYRLVYQYGTLSPAEVHSGGDLIRYAVANFGLYLRVSGQFHLIVGLLHLFGFRLPETHRFFYLSSSFSDLWRRINVYWKDFMQKVFYLPLLFRLKRTHGETAAMVMSTVVVFVVTWFFHSYQWFWLLGTWLVSLTDTLFWALLGVCLVLNALWEVRRGRARSVGVPRLTASAMLRHGVQTAAMFTLMALLWAMWTSPTMGQFLGLLTTARWEGRDVLLLLGTWVAVGTAGVLAFNRSHRPGNISASRWPTLAGVGLLVLVPLGQVPELSSRLSPSVRAALAEARAPSLNKRDQEQLQRGYYEKLTAVNRFNGELWNIYAARPTRWETLREVGAVRDVEDLRIEELVPGLSITFHGKPLRINSAGMRDREYATPKPAGTYRIAVLGQSYIMGSGVGNDETFDEVLERLLNQGSRAGAGPVEVLNFGAPSFAALQQREAIVTGRLKAYEPDLVIVVGHRSEPRLVSDYLQQVMRRNLTALLPPVLDSALTASGISTATTRDDAQRLMQPYTDRVLHWAYSEMAATIRRDGAVSAFAYIPTPLERQEGDVARLKVLADSAGLGPLLDLEQVFAGRDGRGLIVADWDRHPNARGHELIAEALLRELQSRPELLPRR